MPVVLLFRAPEPNAVFDAIAPAPLPTRTPDRVASVVEEIAPVTANAPEFTAASVEVPDADSVVNAPAAAVVAPTVPLIFIEAVPVKFVTTPLLGVPNAGVTSVGLVANTFAPVPVSSVSAVASCAEVNDPKLAALPTLVTAPVRFALVVVFPAVKPAAVPVTLVITPEAGVPRAGVTSVGLVFKTLLPVPVLATLTTFLLASSASAVEAVSPAKLVTPDVVSVVNAPDDAVEAPTLVPLIVPPVIVTLASASASIALFSSARVIFFIDVAEVSYTKKTSSAAVAEPVIALSAPGLTLASDSLAKG